MPILRAPSGFSLGGLIFSFILPCAVGACSGAGDEPGPSGTDGSALGGAGGVSSGFGGQPGAAGSARGGSGGTLADGSAGKGVLPGGKDLGANVSLVGPGAAYQRWKTSVDP